MASPIRIGISACLLGQEVRFDGGHKRDHFLINVLGPHVEYVPVCPEVEMGLGTPRETLRLVRQDGGLRMITTRTAIDHTEGMTRWAAKRLRELADEDLSGYVLKKDSPSCGMERVKTYSENGPGERNGRGIFAAALLERFPQLPVEEEGRLGDPTLRENFIERVFAYRRLQDLFNGRWSAGDLVRFHTAHKMSLLAHSTVAYNQLGQLVAGAGSARRAAPQGQPPRSAALQGCLTNDDLRDAYRSLFMRTLAVRATRARHTNVLQHMAGHLKTLLSAEARADLAQTITEYHAGLVPLVVPVTLIRHYVRLHHVAYLEGQVYLDPHPREMMLRNHV